MPRGRKVNGRELSTGAAGKHHAEAMHVEDFFYDTRLFSLRYTRGLLVSFTRRCSSFGLIAFRNSAYKFVHFLVRNDSRGRRAAVLTRNEEKISTKPCCAPGFEKIMLISPRRERFKA